MDKGRNNCDEIKRASRRVTNITLLPYKSPILYGAIQINKEYNKNVNDGIDYKRLCQDLHKYVNAQKKCVQEVTASQKRSFFAKEWKDIIQGLVQTYNAKNIKKICYYEGDKETATKKHVLNIHDVFRKFCIEKKSRFQNLGDMDFLQCNDYMSWITEKKRGLQALDPNYENIREYQEYFDIHHNCNYPWLVSNTPDVTCSRLTRTKAPKKDKPDITIGDTIQNPIVTTHVTTSSEKKDKSPAEKPPAEEDVNTVSVKSSDGVPGKKPITSTATDDSNSSNSNGEPQMDDMWLVGFPISESHYIPKNIPDDKHLEYQSFLYFLYNNLYGQKIPHDIRQTNNIEPKKFLQKYPNYVHGEPITPMISKSNNYMPTKNLRKQRINPVLLNNQPLLKVIPRLQQFPELIHNSHRYQIGKKKRRKKLKRQLKIKKLPKEASHFYGVDKYSINDISYENKTHYKDMHSHIKLQKGIINKNISLSKRKKKKRKDIIDIHMEMLNESKNDEWELKKNDFFEICLEQFIIEQNKAYPNLEHNGFLKKNISTYNTKEDIMFLWDKWAETFTPIWEHFKGENTFKILQNEWKEEENAYFDKIEKQNSYLNENVKFSYIEIKKDIWRRWITKQTKLIELYKEEQWFKSLVEELENVSDEYKKGKIKEDIFVENIKELENKENNEKLYKLDKHIFLIKLLIQIFMMVIEECIKEENPEQTEVLLDNLINKLNKEKRTKVESENIHQQNMNHMEYNEMLEQYKPKNEDSFKELIKE
ncbi:STP1 protein [Plasmodium ovale wallikeri]|uniref:STP1 protein n=1 Tax=Plasmodium ovale wallikeri TaxID=864142 RepID=A0A1A9AGY1_PLAOA|nr:STP1 protein [Plasmodium ovale wallikeri]SBT58101.1 STP1 protein [Plasmodium ovale wallikeri]